MRGYRTSIAGRVAALLLALLATATALGADTPIPPLDSPVVDTTGTLSTGTREALVQQALALESRKGSQLQVLIVPSTGDETIEQYAQRVFEAWKLGRKDVDDGVLLLVAKDDRTVRIQTGYGLEGAIPDITARRVIDEYLVPRFREGNFDGGVQDATGALVKLIDGEPLPPPMSGTHGQDDDTGAVLAALFVFGVLAHRVLAGIPRMLRGVLFGTSAAWVVWWISHSVGFALFAGVLGFLFGVANLRGGGRFSGSSGWGSTGGGGGWSSSSSGGGWSSGGGGGGSSGGGGASGSW